MVLENALGTGINILASRDIPKAGLMIKILHFADAHIDMANYGRHDPVSGLPLRVLDFLHALDAIVDAAIAEKVDLVLFAGDAYKDRSPAPTYQREWGKRIMRLSQAGIRTLLLLGNHDSAPALGRAHAIQEFDTLQVPHVRVVDKPTFIKAGEFEGLDAQILAIPWLSRSRMTAELELEHGGPGVKSTASSKSASVNWSTSGWNRSILINRSS